MESPGFRRAVLLSIVLNTVALALDSYGAGATLVRVLSTLNLVFTCLFSAELACKVAAYGARECFRDKWNVFDLLIVLVAWSELVVVLTLKDDFHDVNVTAFRALRILRLVKLARRLPGLQRVVRMVLRSVDHVVYLIGLVFLVIFVAALLGWELFHSRFAPPSLQYNFDSFGWSFITCFVVCTGENWDEIMHAGAGSLPPADQWHVVAYAVILSIIGRYLVLNLFTSMLLANISDMKDATKLATRLSKLRNARTWIRPSGQGRGRAHSATDVASIAHSLLLLSRQGGHPAGVADIPRTAADAPAELRIAQAVDVAGVHLASAPAALPGGMVALDRWSRWQVPPEHPIRRAAQCVVRHAWFERVMILVILASSLVLAIDTPSAWESAGAKLWFFVSDCVFAVVFTAELALRAYGADAVLRTGWDLLDAGLVVVAWMAVAWAAAAGPAAAGWVWLLRLPRLLRVVSKSPGMRLVASSLLRSLPEVANVFLIFCLFVVSFGILGMQVRRHAPAGGPGIPQRPSLTDVVRPAPLRAAALWGALLGLHGRRSCIQGGLRGNLRPPRGGYRAAPPLAPAKRWSFRLVPPRRLHPL